MKGGELLIISICGVFLCGCSQQPRGHFTPSSSGRLMGYSTASPMSSAVSTAQYTHYDDNPLKQTAQTPLSTFSLDVDTGSYANTRRFLQQGQLPDPDAVRIEEMLNYFPLNEMKDGVQQTSISAGLRADDGTPFSVNYEMAPAPWNKDNTLLRLDILAKDPGMSSRKPKNLVLLIDTSGSMMSDERLPLIKSAFKSFVNELQAQDRIAIVTYSGRSELLLPSTPMKDKNTIINALDSLDAQGSTNGGEGLKMAYDQASKNFVKDGVNRILLATDGDFNVGIDDPKDIERLVKKQRDSGITLSTLGVGDSNFNDAMMVSIADAGNGNYSYLDTALEAQKVLHDELNQTLVTVAKDVKAQLEFNPENVIEYRQIGYEKRQLNDADFNNDAVDAGDIGAGKHVTVLYELTLAGQKPAVDKLRYATKATVASKARPDELLWVKLRYKTPQNSASKLLEMPISRPPEQYANRAFSSASSDMRFITAVAAWGQKLRESEYLASTKWQQIAQWGEQAKGNDPKGYRAEFVRLVRLSGSLISEKESLPMER